MEESRIEGADDRIHNTSQVNYTYIVKCSDETLYTGWTNDLEKRLRAHNSGKGAKYTKNRRRWSWYILRSMIRNRKR